LGQSRPSCPCEPNVVVWDVTSAGLFSAWHPTFGYLQLRVLEALKMERSGMLKPTCCEIVPRD
jgi:hypothetical protein